MIRAGAPFQTKLRDRIRKLGDRKRTTQRLLRSAQEGGDERYIATLRRILTQTEIELEAAYEESTANTYIPWLHRHSVKLGDEPRVSFVREKTFDDAPECDKPGVVVPIRGRGK